jgi:hypothetical protein
MKYNLNNTSELVSFFNYIFKDNRLTNKAPEIMRFFIITRNYGFINYKDNIIKLLNGANTLDLSLEVIKKGFELCNETFTNDSLIKLLITNYHQNGFYFHSFPGIYYDSIIQNGLLSNNRNELDNKYFAIAEKYHFGEYFTKSNNRVCVSEKIGSPSTSEYAIFTPEWLNLFLKQGNGNIDKEYANGDINELTPIINNALNYFKEGMKRNPSYNENDYDFLCTYINDCVTKRFVDGNNKIGICLIEKDKADNYFGKHIKEDDIPSFTKYIETRGFKEKEIMWFIIEGLSNGEKKSNNSIPKELINIVSYEIGEIKVKESKAVK